MSGYFNPKEEVLYIELTSYGVQQMKDGNLNPSYYAFYDDEVYYGDEHTDSLYNKLKKDDHSRIYKDSSYIRNFKNTSKKAQSYYEISSPLGSAKQGVPYASSIELNLYDPRIKIVDEDLKNSPHKSGDATNTDNIQTIDLGELSYVIEAKELRDYDLSTIEDNLDDVLGQYSTEIFPDQTFIKIDTPDFIMSLSELNVPDDFENFDIELFVEEDGEFREILQEPKYEETMILNDLLVEKDNTEEIEKFRLNHADEMTSSDLFLMEVDEEVPEDVVQKYFKDTKYKTNTEAPINPADVYSETLSGPFGEECE